MSYGPDYNQGIPQQTSFVRKVKSKVFEMKDYIMRCPDSQSALNGWRLLCEFEYGMVMNIAEWDELPKSNGARDWPAYIEELRKEFEEMKTSEKTEIKVISTGVRDKYSVQWDSYIGEFAPQEFDRGIEVMDKEKYDAICHRLMQLCGKFEFVLFACNALKMEDEIETPKPLDTYTDEHLHGGIASRKVQEPRQDSQKQPR